MKKSVLAILLVFTFFSAAFFYDALAAEKTISFYEVNNITITASGDNQATMRDGAISEGQRKAMWDLQNKLKSKGFLTEIRKITDEHINQSIESIEVRDEKIFTKSYRARLNVKFSPKVISRIFNVGIIQPSIAPEKYLVMPILTDAEGTKLWRHEWWDIMQRTKSNYSVLPLGDLEDVRSFTKEDFNLRDFRNLLKIQNKYVADAILLADAEIIPGEKSVKLKLEKIKGGESESYEHIISGKGDSTQTELLAQAANDLIKRINVNDFKSSFKHEETEKPTADVLDLKDIDKGLYQKVTPRTESTLNPADKSIPANMSVQTPKPQPAQEEEEETASEAEAEYNPLPSDIMVTDTYIFADDLISWGRIRSKLTKTKKIKNIRIKSFTAGKAYITLEHEGEFIDLMSQLNADGLLVGKGEKFWEIREKKGAPSK